jgi:hypothetical protein
MREQVHPSIIKLSRIARVTITRVGTNEKYASGWESIFGGKKAKSSKTTPDAKSKTKTKSVKKAAKSPASKPAAKKVAKKGTAKPLAKKAAKKGR